MAEGITCYVTVHGKPLCTRPWLMTKAGVTQCAYTSLRQAVKAKRELWKHVTWWGLVKVVRGLCPEAAAYKEA